MSDTEAGLREWVVFGIAGKNGERTQVMLRSFTQKSGRTQRDRPVIADQVLDIAAGCGVCRGRTKGAEDQPHQLVAHELVLDEEGGDEVVFSSPYNIGDGNHFWQRAFLDTAYRDILDDLDDTLDGIKKNRRVIIEINYE